MSCSSEYLDRLSASSSGLRMRRSSALEARESALMWELHSLGAGKWWFGEFGAPFFVDECENPRASNAYGSGLYSKYGCRPVRYLGLAIGSTD